MTPGVAFDGTNYFVVWEDDRTDSGGDIYGARVSAASGTTLDPAGISITKLAADEDNPSIAFDGTGYVVVWATGDIRGARVTTSGVVVDAAGFLVNGSAGFQGAPSIAYGAPNYFVTWSDLRSGVANIYGARVTPVGGILDPTGIAIATGANTLATSAVAFDGFNFPTAFADTTAGLAYLSWIRPDGVVLGPPGFAVLPPGQKLSGAPAVASDGAGNTMVGYARGSYAPPFGSIRVWSRLAHFGSSLGSACQAAADCGSGFCVDGVCCNTLCGNGVPNDCQVCSVAAGAAVDGTCSPVPQGPVCRPSAGVCDLTEVCDGVQLACPPNGFVPAGTECGASTGPCDPAEACTGQFPLCPANVMLPDGAACNDADACTMADHCMGGACAGAPVTCANTDQCHPSGACNAQTGQCVYPALPDATPCDDGDACTQMDACQNGSCTGGTPVVCPPPDQCHLAGACNAQTGLCSNPAKPSLSPCDDGDACTTGDVCKNGACVAGAPVVCPSATQCHDAGTCDPQTGACSAETKKPDGAGCTDGNLCTLDDSCQGGVCVAGAPLECPALDDCHEAGNCSKTTGQCSKPKKPNGSPCPGGTCQTGKCVPDGTGAGGSGGDGNTGGSGTTTASGAGGFATTGTSGTTATTGTGADASNDSGGGCGCGVVGSPVGGASWAAIGLLALLRRRKKRPALE
ncbi:MAG: MYXO-CTERM sorting domain-containing protein [Minicystis sp.]